MKRCTFFSGVIQKLPGTLIPGSFFLCLLLFFQPGFVHGQGWNGPVSFGPVMADSPVPVSEARLLPHDSWVMLTGNIVNSLPGGKYYTFRDSTGEIPVEIDWKVWRGLTVGTSDPVEISGEVKIKSGQTRIKVKAMANPGETNARYAVTVSAARTLPHDWWVIISGNIVSAAGKDTYLFRDSSGEIIVKIGTKEWRGLRAGPQDRIEISGEVKIKKGQVTIDVKAIRGA